MRLWMEDQVGEIKDKARFMEMYVEHILAAINQAPIDIYVNPTFLPNAIAADYDHLRTPERVQKVIDAAKRNDVAIEINNAYRLPTPAFTKAADKAGVKFAFATNHAGRTLGRLEYCVKMVKESGLVWQEIFVPKPDGEKPVQKRRFREASPRSENGWMQPKNSTAMTCRADCEPGVARLSRMNFPP